MKTHVRLSLWWPAIMTVFAAWCGAVCIFRELHLDWGWLRFNFSMPSTATRGDWVWLGVACLLAGFEWWAWWVGRKSQREWVAALRPHPRRSHVEEIHAGVISAINAPNRSADFERRLTLIAESCASQAFTIVGLTAFSFEHGACWVQVRDRAVGHAEILVVGADPARLRQAFEGRGAAGMEYTFRAPSLPTRIAVELGRLLPFSQRFVGGVFR